MRKLLQRSAGIMAVNVLMWVSLGTAPRLAAQDARFADAPRALVLQAGQWYEDVNGMIVASIRAELPLAGNGHWLIVPGVTYAHFTYEDTPVPEVDLLAPEVLVHLQLGQGWLRPYVGGGAGIVLVNMFHKVDPVLSLGAGMRADLTPRLSARIEVDTRMFGQFNAGSVGWSVGLARRF